MKGLRDINVVGYVKNKQKQFSQYQFELKDWVSPAIRDYWAEFISHVRNNQLLAWAKELQQEAESTHAPAPIKLHPEALKLLETLAPEVGEEIHVGQWFEVTQERIQQFANVTEDQQWIHTDPVRAEEESPFKTTIAHGFLTLALLPVLTDSVNPDIPQYPSAKMAVNYGLNQVRFPYPVKAGSRIRARTRLARVEPMKRGLELVKEVTVEIEGMRRPACVAESVVRLFF